MNSIEEKSLDKEGYEKVFSFQSWLVAHLSHNKDTDIENIRHFQKHNDTDEVFVLLKGKMNLLIVDDINDMFNTLHIIPLKLNTAYRVPKGVYHEHILSHDANALIVEESATCDENSPIVMLTKQQREQLQKVVMEDKNGRL